jgi:hypothetical protein
MDILLARFQVLMKDERMDELKESMLVLMKAGDSDFH